MAFCSSGLAVIKKLRQKITPELEIILNVVIDFTSKLKSLEANPAVQLIISLIPENQVFVNAINTAIDTLSAVSQIAAEPNTLQKLTGFINEIKALSPQAANGQLLKLASLIVTELHAVQNNTPLTEVEADSLVQLQLLINKDASSK